MWSVVSAVLRSVYTDLYIYMLYDFREDASARRRGMEPRWTTSSTSRAAGVHSPSSLTDTASAPGSPGEIKRGLCGLMHLDTSRGPDSPGRRRQNTAGGF